MMDDDLDLDKGNEDLCLKEDDEFRNNPHLQCDKSCYFCEIWPDCPEAEHLSGP
jgi:hypothetical protein